MHRSPPHLSSPPAGGALSLRAALVATGLVLASPWAFAQPADPGARAQSTVTAWATRHAQSQIYTAILAAELALIQGDRETASAAYAELARLSGDASVAERAVELALRAGEPARALEVVERWTVAQPDSPRPRLIQLALALAGSDNTPARSAMNGLLELPAAAVPGAIMDAARQLAQLRDRDRAIEIAQLAVERRPDLPEAHYALAAATTGTHAQRAAAALAALDRALALRPLWPQAIVLKSRLRLATTPDAQQAELRESTLAEVSAALLAHPEARELRELRARILYDMDRFEDARREFLALAEEGKEDADEQRFAATLASFAARDWATAERELLDAERVGRGEPLALAYYLGRVAEAEGRWSVAAERYARVDRGERAFEAQLRRATAMARDKRIIEAVTLLKTIEPANPRQANALARTESMLWRDAREHARALEILDGLLEHTPEDTGLLYDSAILLEQLKRPAEAEARLRRVIALDPKSAHALNALGYSLADRNERLDEARELIERAYRLAPEDAAIMDSMGWVAYRQGRLADAERHLRAAYAKHADGEIAAHLGEVLWVLGHRDEARAIWRAQLAREPEHEVLRETIRRLDLQE
ncbi:MAG: tetratricopeptide repeat protein [Casimicrobiaceae bacterium]